MPSEYHFIDKIGTTHEVHTNSTQKALNSYYHRAEVGTVRYLLKQLALRNYDTVLDIGSSTGYWYRDYRKLGFKRIVGIDISEIRLNEAKRRGYDEVYMCNAYDLPFEAKSKDCMISNDMFVHVLQDTDKLRILKEAKRILRNNGIFIFNITNAYKRRFAADTTKVHSRYSLPETILRLIEDSGLHTEYSVASYYTFPGKGAHPYIAPVSARMLFPIFDFLLKRMNNLSLAKVVYFGVRKQTEL